MVRSSLSTGPTDPLDINPRLVGGRGEMYQLDPRPSWCRFPRPQMTSVLHYGEVHETLCTGQRGGHEDGPFHHYHAAFSHVHPRCNCPELYTRSAQNLAIPFRG